MQYTELPVLTLTFKKTSSAYRTFYTRVANVINTVNRCHLPHFYLPQRLGPGQHCRFLDYRLHKSQTPDSQDLSFVLQQSTLPLNEHWVEMPFGMFKFWCRGRACNHQEIRLAKSARVYIFIAEQLRKVGLCVGSTGVCMRHV